MNTTTLADLLRRARARADMPVGGALTQKDWIDNLNAYGAELHDLIIASFEDRVEDVQTFAASAVNSSGEYALPSLYLKTLSMDYTTGGYTYTVPKYENAERNTRQTLTGARFATLSEFQYRVVGNVIRFIPVPSSSSGGDFTHRYAPEYRALVELTDPVPPWIKPGWEEYQVLGAAADARVAEETDETPLLRRQEMLRDRIIAAAQTKDANEPARVIDVRGAQEREGRGW